MKRFTISASSTWDVIVDSGLTKRLVSYIHELNPSLKDPSSLKIALISDSSTNEALGSAILESLRSGGFDARRILFPAGEHSKNLNTYGNILESLGDMGLSRHHMVIALGGQGVLDMAAFVAGTYMRGIQYISIPTTLQASLDGALGGKAGLNLLCGKNMAGVFWNPSLVLLDEEILLDPHSPNLSEALVEAVKYAAVSEEKLLTAISKKDLSYVLDRCLSIKKSLVEADERGNNLSRLLDFGLTIGQALEKLSNYNLSHGQALAKGMVAEAKGAYKLGLTKVDISKDLEEILSSLGFDSSLDYSPEDLYKQVLQDEKIAGDKISMPVPESLGKATIKKLPLVQLKDLTSSHLQ